MSMFDEAQLDQPGKVRRSKDGRPYVKRPCPNAVESTLDDDVPICREGRVPSEKRPGQTVQCPGCKGLGYVEKLYTRCTSFVGVLDDRSNLEKWRQRVTLVGLGVDHRLLTELGAADPDDRETLDGLADQAFEVGDGHVRAQKGTDLHALTELVDQGEPLPDRLFDPEREEWRPVTLQDRADMAAYHRVMTESSLEVVQSELFVVNDEYRIGGTLDRVVWDTTGTDCCAKPMILDVKTGRVDYGAGKIAMQLAVYANSQRYDPDTGERTPLGVCTHVGLALHLPQGTGTASLLVADIAAGWESVALCDQVRKFRNVSKSWLKSLQSE